MAVDMFLLIKDVPGETKDKDPSKKDAIDILAWSWGLSQSGTFHAGGGGGAGKANFQDLSVTKFVDASSHILMLYCANGKHFDEAVITVRKAGGDEKLDYIKITMTQVMVTSVSTGGSGGEDRLTENVTLNFAQVAYEYTKQGPKGAADGAALPFKWDIAGNDKNT